MAARKKSHSTRRKTNTSGRKKTSSSRRNTKAEESIFPWTNEIVVLVTLAISILLFISNLNLGGMLGEAFSSFFFGLFGLMSYIFPLVLFLLVAFIVSNDLQGIVLAKVIAGMVFYLFFCVFVYLVSYGGKEYIILSAYEEGAFYHTGGGVFGNLLGQGLNRAFGVVGAFVITIITLIISMVILTEKSFFMGIRKGSQKVYDSAREDAERYKEERERQREIRQEKKQRRMDRKVEGVALDTKIHRTTPETSDEMLEMKPEEPKKNLWREIKSGMNKMDHGQNIEETPVIDMEREEVSMEEIPEEIIHGMVVLEEPEEIEIPEEPQKFEEPYKEPEGQAAPVKKPAAKPESVKEHGSAQERSVQIEETKQMIEYKFPPISLLKKNDAKKKGDSKAQLRETAMKLQQTLKNFGVNVTITNVSCGPAVTRYELSPEQGVKVSKIVNLADDIKLNLAAADIRIEAPIPGKAAVGIEVPNKENVMVTFRELVESEEFKKHKSPIAFAAGKDIGGKVVVADIGKMPHLLIAGATGSGKSVCINTIIMSIIYRANPNDVKLIMIDPKVVELSVYNGIPHLYTPVVTDPKKAAGALQWAVDQMTMRYKLFADFHVRDLKGYNGKVEELNRMDGETKAQKMPQIVIIVDELADLMMVAPGDVEDSICRLAQLARAAGIHLIIATQRPSVNVITGLIKANMPSRVAFAVSSGVDSRTILDMNGAEKLLGKGDMLFYPQGYQKPLRVQGAFVSDEEVQDVVSFLIKQNEEITYNNDIEESMNQSASGGGTSSGGRQADDRDIYFGEAGKYIIEKEKGSIGMLQRVFKIGFNRAARIMDQLEEAGVVGPEEGTKPRRVLMTMEAFESYLQQDAS